MKRIITAIIFGTLISVALPLVLGDRGDGTINLSMWGKSYFSLVHEPNDFEDVTPYKEGTILLVMPVGGENPQRYQAGDVISVLDGEYLFNKLGAGVPFLGKEEIKKFVVIYIPRKLTEEEKRLYMEEDSRDEIGLDSEGEEILLSSEFKRRRNWGLDFAQILSEEDFARASLEKGLKKIVSVNNVSLIKKVDGELSVVRPNENQKKRLLSYKKWDDLKNTFSNKILPKTKAATDVTKAIKASGGDYTTIVAWEAAIPSNLVTADQRWIGELYDEVYDEYDVEIGSGITTDATRNIILRANSSAIHDGTAGSGARIVTTATTQSNQGGLEPDANYTVIENIELDFSASTGGATNQAIGIQVLGGHTDIILRRNIVHDMTKHLSNRGILIVGTSGANMYIVNNLVYDIQRTSTGGGRCILAQNSVAGTTYVYNNTSYNCQQRGITASSFTSGSANIVVSNNISANGGTDFLYDQTAGSITTDRNLSTDATADDDGSGTHLISQTLANIFVSTTDGSEDLHLKAGSPAIDQGSDLSTTKEVNIDIDQYDRDAGGVTWDIGADELQFPTIDIAYFRWFLDNNIEGYATPIASENTNATIGTGIGDRRRIRFVVRNVGSGNANDITYKLEQSSSSCSVWIAVPTNTTNNTHWVTDYSSYLTDNGATTNSNALSDPASKSFVAGYQMTFDNITPAHDMSSTQFTEHEFTIRSTSYITTGTNYCFRLTNEGDATYFTYTVTPNITIPTSYIRPEAGGVTFEGNGVGSSVTGGGNGGGSSVSGEGSGSGNPIGGGGQGGGGSIEGAYTENFTDMEVLLTELEVALVKLQIYLNSK